MSSGPENFGMSESEINKIQARAVAEHINEISVDDFAADPEGNAHVLEMMPNAEANPIRDNLIDNAIEHLMVKHGVTKVEAMKMILGQLNQMVLTATKEEEGKIDGIDGE